MTIVNPGGGSTNPLGLTQAQITQAAKLQKAYPTVASFAAELNKVNKSEPVPAGAVAGVTLTGSTIGAQFTNWHAARSSQFPSTVTLGDYEEAFADGVLAPAELAEAIADAAKGVGDFTADAAKGTVGGLDEAADPLAAVEGFIGGFTAEALWVRVAKISIGGVIIIVGLASLTGATGTLKKVAKSAGPAAPLLLV